ncbi:MAG TPA: hypothetical protein VMN78_04520 [Longimicrobiales bacterium]|nr:hypothetical protein [Longimicrobiales bacterium]
MHRIRSIAVPLVLGVLLSGCPELQQPPPPGVSFDALNTLIEGNPCDEDPPDPSAVVALTGRTEHQNEIHDCQRLVHAPAAGGPHEFGPLVAVYPLKHAMDLTSADDFEGSGVAVASVYNWAKANTPGSKYAPLGIEEGWSCLWLKVEDSTWTGQVTPTTVECGNAVAPTSGWLLGGHREPQPSTAPPVPPTARWGWTTGNRHYIGIKCGDGWCSIGPPGFQQPPPPPPTAVNRGLHAGWYDEQHLAVPKQGGGGLEPGPQAFIFPTDSLLALRNVPDGPVLDAAFAGGFEVATIEVHGGAAPHPYGRKFNLAINNNVGTSTIWLQLLPGKDTARVSYRNRVTAAQDTTAPYLSSTRHAARGAVRWRWQGTDETAWISCKSGCCDAQEL